MANFTMVNYSITRNHICSLHAFGCKDIKKDAYEHGGHISHNDFTSVQQALDSWFDEEMLDMGWTSDACKVMPCAEAKERELRPIKVTSQTARVVCKNTVTPAVSGEDKEKPMSITKTTSVFQLRKQHSDYTILRLLCKRSAKKITPAQMIKKHGSAYKAARLILANIQKVQAKRTPSKKDASTLADNMGEMRHD